MATAGSRLLDWANRQGFTTGLIAGVVLIAGAFGALMLIKLWTEQAPAIARVSVGEITNQGPVAEIAAAAEKNANLGTPDGGTGVTATERPAGLVSEEDAEAERQLAEIRQRIAEEERRNRELAQEAEFAPLGQSLYSLAAAPAPDEDLEPETDPGQAAPEAPAPLAPGGMDETSAGRALTDERVLRAGTVIPASLITTIDSGLPGLARAQVTAPVRDSTTGTRVLIPGGALVVGTYADGGGVNDERLFVHWRALQLPDGTTHTLDEAPVADLSGMSGLVGQRRSRFWSTLGKAFAINLVTAITARPQAEDNAITDAIKSAAGDTAQTVTERMVERDLNAAPVFRIPSGTPMNIVLEENLWLPPYGPG